MVVVVMVIVIAVVAVLGGPCDMEQPSCQTAECLSRRWRRSVVVSALASINVVNRHWARLLLGLVTACGSCGQANCLGV